MNDNNLTINDTIQYSSMLIICKEINVFATIVIIIIGLVGNIITTVVFSHSKFRKNSGHVYMLTLAIYDSLFLLIHFLEDTIRTYKDITRNNNKIIDILNITDHNNFTCRVINYFRYTLRFISAYIVVSFTIQRMDIMYNPLSTKFKSRKSAWQTVIAITLTALIINIWVPFMFRIQLNEENDEYCDIDKLFKFEYFYINIVYTFFIMLLPMVIITICNSLIIYKTFKDEKIRKSNLHIIHINHHQKENLKIKQSDITTKSKILKKPHYFTEEQLIERNLKSVSKNSLRKMTFQLVFISFSFVLFNLPYLSTWFLYFFSVAFNKFNRDYHDLLYEMLQICEIFYIINYSFKFYIYCATGSKFSSQLKYLSKNIYLPYCFNGMHSESNRFERNRVEFYEEIL